jgi:hypothetical protein
MGKTRHHYYASPSYEEDMQADTPTLVTEDQTERTWAHWQQDCETWRGQVLVGRYVHWCAVWDYLPMDETCPEWPCQCGIVEEVDGTDLVPKY